MSIAYVPFEHYVITFKRANATSPENARTLEELRCPETWTLRRLVLRGVILQCDENRLYLDCAAYQDFVRAENDRLYLIAKMTLLLVIICFIWLLVKMF
jgi:hypothetical protein